MELPSTRATKAASECKPGRIFETPDMSGITSGNCAGRIFGAADAAERFGVSFSTLKRGWPKGIYPAPVRVSENRIGWLEADILRWQRERVEERDARVMQNQG